MRSINEPEGPSTSSGVDSINEQPPAAAVVTEDGATVLGGEVVPPTGEPTEAPQDAIVPTEENTKPADDERPLAGLVEREEQIAEPSKLPDLGWGKEP